MMGSRKTKDEVIFPAEWAPQSGVMITWPEENHPDWCNMLLEVKECFTTIAKEILKREDLWVLCPLNSSGAAILAAADLTSDSRQRLHLVEIETNGTWIRDYGAMSVMIGGEPAVVDFGFNAWGLKYAANFDNQVNSKLFFKQHVFAHNVEYINRKEFILEGGSIVSDGAGTLLTTSSCLLSKNRNQTLSRGEIEEYLKDAFGLQRVLWLNHGYLAGDDTDSHVDTLARFCNENTIAYVKCDDSADEHFDELERMEAELKEFRTLSGEHYNLLPLPLPDAVYDGRKRLDATYVNFLVINGAVLVPFYGTDKDKIVASQLQSGFPNRKVVGINCLPLIKRNGSLHCSTMQFPKGVLDN